MKLTKQTLPGTSNRVSLYQIGEDGREYVYFKSKKQKLIVRDFFKTDVTAYYNAIVEDANKRNGNFKRKYIKTLENIIAKRNVGNNKVYSLLITTVSDKIVGCIDVYENGADATLQIVIRESEQKDLIAKKVIDAVKELQEQYFWYDNLYLSNGEVTNFIGSTSEYM